MATQFQRGQLVRYTGKNTTARNRLVAVIGHHRDYGRGAGVRVKLPNGTSLSVAPTSLVPPDRDLKMFAALVRKAGSVQRLRAIVSTTPR